MRQINWQRLQTSDPKGRMAAISATARKLAVIIWNMVVKKVPYQPISTMNMSIGKEKEFDAWGSGTKKLPDPEIIEQDGEILVTLFKNKDSKEQLQKMNLNGPQVGAVLYILGKR